MSFIRPYSALVSAMQRLLDVAFIALALAAAMHANNQDWNSLTGWALVLASVVFVGAGEAMQLYGSWRLKSLEDEFRTVFASWLLAGSSVIVAAFLAKLSSNLSRATIVIWILIVPSLLVLLRLASRSLLKWLRSRGMNTRRAAIAGATVLADTVVAHLEQSHGFGAHVIGIYDDRSGTRIEGALRDPSRVVGSLNDLLEQAHKGEL